MAAPSPLRVAVLGAGNIGSAFALRLARVGGHEVTVVARPGSERLRQLCRDGGIVTVAGERADVAIRERLDPSVAYDLVIVTMLAHRVHAVLPELRASVAARVLFMANSFEPERFFAEVGAGRCALGMPFVQASLEDGRLAVAIGAGGKTKLGDPRDVALFDAAGIPAALEPDMPLWLRCHAPSCVAFESVSVAAVRRGGGASWTEALVLARGMHACYALIRGLGYAVYPPGKARLERSPSWAVAAMLWALSRVPSFRRLLAGGADECRALVDAMAAAAAHAASPGDRARIEAMRPA